MALSEQDICQFAPNAARGDAALALSGNSQAIAVMISPNQATGLNAGDAVRFDTAQNLPGNPWVIAAGIGDTAHGILKKDVKQGVFSMYDIADMLTNMGPFSVQVAAATVVPGSVLETTSTGAVQVKSAQVAKYMAIDYATVGQNVRCALLPVTL